MRAVARPPPVEEAQLGLGAARVRVRRQRRMRRRGEGVGAVVQGGHRRAALDLQSMGEQHLHCERALATATPNEAMVVLRGGGRGDRGPPLQLVVPGAPDRAEHMYHPHTLGALRLRALPEEGRRAAVGNQRSNAGPPDDLQDPAEALLDDAHVGDRKRRADTATVRCCPDPMHRLEQHAEDLRRHAPLRRCAPLSQLGDLHSEAPPVFINEVCDFGRMGPDGGAVAVYSANSAAQSSMKEQDMPPAKPEDERVARHSAAVG